MSLALCIALAALPLGAEETPPATDRGEVEEGMSLMERGAKLLFEGLAREIEPAMRDMAEEMQDFAANLEPMLREVARLMDDLSAYNMPEMLPNGDIIIRRKTPGEPGFRTLPMGPDGETEL